MAKKNDEACEMAKTVFDKALGHEDTALLGSLAYSLRTPALKENKELLSVAVKAAEANVKILGESDFNAVTSAMDTYLAAGESAKANASAVKAIAAAKLPYHISALLRSPIVKDNKELLGGVLKAAETQLKEAGQSNYAQIMTWLTPIWLSVTKRKPKSMSRRPFRLPKQRPRSPCCWHHRS